MISHRDVAALKPGIQDLAISFINDAESIQSRAEVSPDAVDDYSHAMREGAEFLPIVVILTARRAVLLTAFIVTRPSSTTAVRLFWPTLGRIGRVEALLHAVGANAGHGLRRTNKDKAHAVALLLAEPTCADWSDREIRSDVRRQPHDGRRCPSSEEWQRLPDSAGRSAVDSPRFRSARPGTAYLLAAAAAAERYDRDDPARRTRKLPDASRLEERLLSR